MTCLSRIRTSFIFLTLLTGVLALPQSYCQTIITGIESYYDDSASEWTMYGLDPEEEQEMEEMQEIDGSLRIKWILRNDFSEWTFDYNNEISNIKMKFDDFSRWELRTENNDIVDIQTKWRNDITEWKITHGGSIYKWQSEYKNELNSWFFETDSSGYFDMYTLYSNDSRDWGIEDQTIDIPDCVKLAAIFITIYCTTPKQ